MSDGNNEFFSFKLIFLYLQRLKFDFNEFIGYSYYYDCELNIVFDIIAVVFFLRFQSIKHALCLMMLSVEKKLEY